MPTQLVGSVKDSRLGTTIGSITAGLQRPKQAASVLRGGFAKEVATRGDLPGNSNNREEWVGRRSATCGWVGAGAFGGGDWSAPFIYSLFSVLPPDS